MPSKFNIISISFKLSTLKSKQFYFFNKLRHQKQQDKKESQRGRKREKLFGPSEKKHKENSTRKNSRTKKKTQIFLNIKNKLVENKNYVRDYLNERKIFKIFFFFFFSYLSRFLFCLSHASINSRCLSAMFPVKIQF